jgi:hypothetical protein
MSVPDALWTDKHRPRCSQEIVGNAGCVTRLRAWLRQWSVARGTNAAAALLSGPPGVGKTCAAHLVARECGFVAVEVNASDAADARSAVFRDVVAYGRRRDPQLLIVEDLDAGLSGLSGLSELLAAFRASKVPIICICNDKWDPKLKAVRAHAAGMELDFQRPPVALVVERLLHVCAREGLAATDQLRATVEQLARRADGDVRSLLTLLQWGLPAPTGRGDIQEGMGEGRVGMGMVGMVGRVGMGAGVGMGDGMGDRTGVERVGMGAGVGMVGRVGMGAGAGMGEGTGVGRVEMGMVGMGGRYAIDRECGPFEAASRLLSRAHAATSVDDRVALLRQDSLLVPLLLQENYCTLPMSTLASVSRATDLFSLADVLSRHSGVAADALNALAPLASFLSKKSALPQPQPQPPPSFPRFPAWLGNCSTSGKQRRVLCELTAAMQLRSAPRRSDIRVMRVGRRAALAGRDAMRTDYLPAMRTLLPAPLRTRGGAAASEVVALSNAYGLDRGQFDQVLDVTGFKTQARWGAHPMQDVPAAVKAALTRAFNASSVAKTQRSVRKPSVKTRSRAVVLDDSAAASVGSEQASGGGQ